MATPAHPFEFSNNTSIEVRNVEVNLASRAWALSLIREHSPSTLDRFNVSMSPLEIRQFQLHDIDYVLLVYPIRGAEPSEVAVYLLRQGEMPEMLLNYRLSTAAIVGREQSSNSPFFEVRLQDEAIIRIDQQVDPQSGWWAYPIVNPVDKSHPILTLSLFEQSLPEIPVTEWTIYAVLFGLEAEFVPHNSNLFIIEEPLLTGTDPVVHVLNEAGSDAWVMGRFRGHMSVLNTSREGQYPDLELCQSNGECSRLQVSEERYVNGRLLDMQAQERDRVLREEAQRQQQQLAARSRERLAAIDAQRAQRFQRIQSRSLDIGSPAFLLDAIGVQSRPRPPQFSLFGLSVQGGIVPFLPLLPIALAVFILGRGSSFRSSPANQNPAQASHEALALQVANPKLLDVTRMARTRWGTALFVVLGTLMGITIAAFATALALAPVTLFLTPAIFVMAFLAMLVLVVLVPTTQAIMRAGPNSSPTGFVPLSEAHALVQDIHAMCDRLGTRRVRHIGYYQSSSLNAYAQGTDPDHFTMAFSEGLLQALKKDEILAVAGHELGHMLNNDMRMMQTGISIQKSLTWFLIFNRVKKLARVLFTTVSEAALMKLSRSREFWADAVGAALTSPQSMANALRTLEGGSNQKPHPGTARIGYAMIYQQGFDGLRGLFATHPPIPHRIAAIEASTYIDKLPYVQPETSSEEVSERLAEEMSPMPPAPARPT